MSDTANQQDLSDEDLAAAWGAETDAADGLPVQAERVLNQAEIDSLLGFDDGPSGGGARRRCGSKGGPTPRSNGRWWRN